MGRKQKKQPQIREDIPSDEDEEIDEDEAFNSDDERKYGMFFQKRDDSDDDDDEDSDSGSEDGSDLEDDDEEEGDGGQYMLDLLNNLDKTDNDEPKTDTHTITNYIKEDPFSSTVIKGTKLTLDALVDDIKDTSEFGAVQKKLKGMMGKSATSTPAARVITERAQRRVNYQQQSKEVSSWIEAVQENRQAETLDFRPHMEGANKITTERMIDSFVPTTDFEREMHEALKAAGQEDEAALIRAEEQAIDALGENEITLEEYKQRRGQLAKMRALMFYEEQKRHHINKIKSKKYRRIRKKQRERQKESEMEAGIAENPELERELQEKEEMERMKERMTLAHKNTSKWAKHILKRGKNVDLDTRKALSAQLRRGDDLLKKMKTSRNGDDSDDSDDDLVATAKKVLEDTESNDADGEEQKGLFKLAFMQRGLQRERERARQEARELLMELEENERLEHDDDEQRPRDDLKPEDKSSARKKKVASNAEMTDLLNDGAMIASTLQFGSTTATAVESSFSVDLGSSASEFTKVMKPSDTVGSQEASGPPAKRQKNEKGSVERHTPSHSTQEDNPWLPFEKKEKKEPSKKVKSNNVSVSVESAVTLIPEVRQEDVQPKNVAETDINKDSKQTGENNKKSITMLSQEELVRRAFATPGDAEEEFALEKKEFEEREDPDNKKRKRNENKKELTSSGWGSWTGKGAPPPQLPKNLPKKFQPPPKLPERQRQDAAKPRVILSERRVKRLADSCMIAEIPYPYKTREEYERAMAGGIGREWNVTNSFKDMTRPEILVRPGQVIQPISKRMKQSRAPAKF
ncbi:U3 small nucleolar RNA-associated protein 14 [Fistulifera solaris]|uniref:U3 small nucleolar RNA-associated protein 14 n=1 Tax=Fistulifera solaris TaxID=1519565 RepID=A0A1Z5KNM8_FISSO|nr:U3 small nucleolar RNA-associated protein 14 [Fistulifera solaris]|eukprot:GAX27924.1 U3 small nucleolar RNA-associated protein 14 [Fistulifera solaris]